MSDSLHEAFESHLSGIERAQDLDEVKRLTINALRTVCELAKRHGVLSNTEIAESMDQGSIIITDFNPENLNGSSYDVTLGEYFYTTDREQRLRTLNTRDNLSIDRHFEGPHQAITNEAWADKYGRQPFDCIDLHEKIIVLEPGERILAHTNEFIGGIGDITTQMQSRSSAGRLGIATCFCAGWGDPGFVNRWTMEVYNLNKEPAVMVVGDRVAQIIFSHTGVVKGEYATMSGNYQPHKAGELDEIIKTWSPTQMLPKPLGRIQ